jgi:hypothetical protein
MNTAFGFFNLAVAIRGMRPNHKNNPHREAAPHEEPVLAAIDYSLLRKLPIEARAPYETLVSTCGVATSVGQIWALKSA